MIDCEHLRIAFAGTPQFAAVALESLLSSKHTVVGVLSQPDRPAGRGRQLTASPVKALALIAGVPILQPLTLRDPEAIQAVSELEADVLVVAAYGLLLPKAVLELPAMGCLNIHASLLPRWRGAAPIQRAILAGDTETGVCIMQMDEGLDTGDVLHSVPVPINPQITASQLHDQLAATGAEALLFALAGRCDGTLTPAAQPTTGATYAAKLDKSEAQLDFSLPAIELHRKIHAFNAWPVAEALLDGVRIRLWRSAVSDIATDAAPGTVVQVTDEAVCVATGQGRLDLLEIQRPGKRAMAAADFCRGRDLIGQVFT